MKKSKTSHSTQDLYETLTQPSKQVAGRKIVVTPLREIVVFPSKNSKVPSDVTIDVEFSSLDDFAGKNLQTILAYHEEFLKCEAPKKQDQFTTACWVWAWFVKNGRPVIDPGATDNEKGRHSTIGDSQYSYGEIRDKSIIKTPQAKSCYDMFVRCIGERPTVSEAELRAFIEGHAQELHTRQDPWRIFQYYRPTLIATKHLRRT